jgi:hypothetical protein
MYRPAIQLAWLIAILVSGCTDDLDGPPDETAPITDDTVFYQTVVKVNSQGFEESEPVAVTAAAQRVQAERRVAREQGDSLLPWDATLDGACAGTSLWYYDRTDYSGNQICFTGCGVAVMQNYVRFYRGFDGKLHVLGTWRINQGSYWPGDRPGMLAMSPDYSTFILFSAWGARAPFNVSPKVVEGIGVGFANPGDPCP